MPCLAIDRQNLELQLPAPTLYKPPFLSPLPSLLNYDYDKTDRGNFQHPAVRHPLFDLHLGVIGRDGPGTANFIKSRTAEVPTGG
jgi:hypothetical protein